MSGRHVYFSFHYENDIWRATNVRKSGQVDARARAGWADSSIWEEEKRKGDVAIRRLIDSEITGTSVTVVLIGALTASRPWVKYEIDKSIERGNGLIGVRIDKMKDQRGHQSTRGETPSALVKGNYRIYDWKRGYLGDWVERAAIKAGKPCLRHKEEQCWKCLLRIWANN